MNIDLPNPLMKKLSTYIRMSKWLQFKKLCNILHPEARIYYANTFESKSLHLHWKEIPDHLKSRDPNNWAKNTKMEILTLHRKGHMAYVKILTKTPLNYCYLDSHVWIWDTNSWKMYSKVCDLIQSPSNAEVPPTGKEWREIIDFFEKYKQLGIEGDNPTKKTLAHPDARKFIIGTSKGINLQEAWNTEKKEISRPINFNFSAKSSIHLQILEVSKFLGFLHIQIGNICQDFHELIKVGKKWFFVNQISQLI